MAKAKRYAVRTLQGWLGSAAGCGKPHVRWCGRGGGRNPVTPSRSRLHGWFYSLDAAPSTGGFERICPTGARQGSRAFFAGAGMPLRKTPFKPEERRVNAGWGGFFFGYFLLAMQKKVSRLPVRELALK